LGQPKPLKPKDVALRVGMACSATLLQWGALFFGHRRCTANLLFAIEPKSQGFGIVGMPTAI
jgi:hypothetical protein